MVGMEQYRDGDSDDDDDSDDALQQNDDYDKWQFSHSPPFRIAPLCLLDSGGEDDGGGDDIEC